jgi:hypothetical protein
MTTNKRDKEAFIVELKDLLSRFNAEIYMESRGSDYYINDVPVVYLNGEWDKEGNSLRNMDSFDLMENI